METRDTEKEFMTAFWKLYEAKPIEKISITQLCRTAGYNRATFYNHFENIYDLLNKAVSDMLLPIRSRVLSVRNFRMLVHDELIGKVLFTYFQQQDTYIEVLFKRQHHYILSEQIIEAFLTHLSEDIRDAAHLEALRILLEYQLSAVLGVINYWFQQGKVMPEQEILQKIFDISTKGVLNSLKAELDDCMK